MIRKKNLHKNVNDSVTMRILLNDVSKNHICLAYHVVLVWPVTFVDCEVNVYCLKSVLCVESNTYHCTLRWSQTAFNRLGYYVVAN